MVSTSWFQITVYTVRKETSWVCDLNSQETAKTKNIYLHNVRYSMASSHIYRFCMFLLSGKNRTRCSVSRQVILWHIELHVLTECGVRSLMTAGAENQSHFLNGNGHRLAVCPHEQRRQSGTGEEVQVLTKNLLPLILACWQLRLKAVCSRDRWCSPSARDEELTHGIYHAT